VPDPVRPHAALPGHRLNDGVIALAIAAIAMHWIVNATTPYGVHRDEMLYVAMGRHFALWRMDGPPAIAAIARIATGLFGTSVFALRILPSLAGAALIVLAAELARTFGGGRFAQALAALAVVASPMVMGASNLLQPVIFDQLCWTLTLYAAARVILAAPEERTRWWVILGLAGGLGVLTKFAIGVLFSSLALAALATHAGRRADWRRADWRRADWRGLAIALFVAALIGSPSLVGQIRLGFPIIGQMRELHSSQLTHVSTSDWLQHLVFLAPTSLLAIAGATRLLRSPDIRIIGLACVAAFLSIYLLHGKFYYAQPVFPTLWAAGAVNVEQVAARRGAWVRIAAPAFIVADALLLFPMSLPVLAPPLLVRYLAALGVTAHTDQGETVQLPPDYADMLGWPEQVAAVATVYEKLPADERSRTVLLARNYGEAAAIDFYGPRYHLPPALTNQGSYYLYGPGDRTGSTAVAIGVPRATLLAFYDSVGVAAHIDNPDAVPEEAHIDIYLCRGARGTIQSLWPKLSGRY
jgi:4-amino-4-deoxy-L-arabinose transferase-like glycosyltransferase